MTETTKHPRLLLVVALSLLGNFPIATSIKPNVLGILCDNLGSGDPQCGQFMTNSNASLFGKRKST
jgi:hypothetical protein